MELDAHTDVSIGRRITDWELRGVPVRVELGPREIATGRLSVALRASGHKTTEALDRLARRMPTILESEQTELLRQANELRDSLTRAVRSIEEAADQAREGAARVPWGTVGPEGERRLLADGISARCLVREDGQPVNDPDADGVHAIVARSY